MAATFQTTSKGTALTLATAPLPPRVRQILEAVNALAAQALSASLNLALNEFERQLFRQSERARSSQEQAECFAELQQLRQRRADLVPGYLADLEDVLARLREDAPVEAQSPAPAPIEFSRLTLVEDQDLDREIILRDIARREAQRGGIPLLLLGQRFGVLAARPAYGPETLPLGPYVLCRLLRAAGERLQVGVPAQLLLYRAFETHVMERYGELVERLNVRLAHEGVLPGLTYQPYRPRTPGQSRPRPAAVPGDSERRPLTGWQGQSSHSAWSGALLESLAALGAPVAATGEAADGAAPAGTAAGEAATPADAAAAPTDQLMFSALRQLLALHRQAVQAPAPAPPAVRLPDEAVSKTLGMLQNVPQSRTPGRRRRTLDDLRRAVVELARRTHGDNAGLTPDQQDTFDLLGLLYGEIGREVHPDAPAQDMLERLQVPVARAALQDRSFFVRERHPARDLLNLVAESGASWLGEEETDPQLVSQIGQTVDRVAEEYDGDEAVFERARQEIEDHYRAQARKAEVSERRQIEAARGRDRLESAKLRAAEAIAARLEDRKPPQFVQALLHQAWADVLTLTALRHGEDSAEWKAREEATARIVAATCDPDAPPDPSLATLVENALRQVGYHGDEAAAIARRLSRADDDAEGPSRTELTARLKARARLGESAQPERKPLPPRNAVEQAWYERLRTLPFGTWFEFVVNQQGEVRRKRLSWYNPTTGNTLFVNARGQKAGEHSLDTLARLMALQQARIVTEDKGRLIDRAWQATLRALRGLAGRPNKPEDLEPEAS